MDYKVKRLLMCMLGFMSICAYSETSKIEFDSVAVSICRFDSEILHDIQTLNGYDDETLEWNYNYNLYKIKNRYVGHIVKLKSEAKGVFYKIEKERDKKKLFTSIHYGRAEHTFLKLKRIKQNSALPDGDPKRCYIGVPIDKDKLINEELKIVDVVQHVDVVMRDYAYFGVRVKTNLGRCNYRLVLQSVKDKSYYFIILKTNEEYTGFNFPLSEVVIKERAIRAKIRARELAVQDSIFREEEKIRLQAEEKRRKEAKLKAEQESLEREKEAKLEEIREQKENAAKIRKWGRKNFDLISEGIVRIGMTKEMCIESWGYPQTINKNISRYGRNEQWMYEGFNFLYFEGNRLVHIQTSE